MKPGSDKTRSRDGLSCQDHPARARLVAFALGRAEPDEISIIARHIEVCSDCAQIVSTVGPDDFVQRLKETQTVPDKPGPTRLCYGYEIIEEMGRGGIGIVYRARQPGLDRPVALKQLLQGAMASPQALRRFKREGEVLANLNHPHIVEVYEVGEQGGHPFIAMQLIEGLSLTRCIDRQVLDARVAAELLIKLCDAIATINREGVIHRDIKPSNIMIRNADSKPESWSPVLIDFGLVQWESAQPNLTATGDLLGTPAYMAPEQLGPQATDTLGPATDVYGLGATLYHCLTGGPPFRGENPAETIQLVRHADVVPISRFRRTIPAELEWICQRCLEKEPERRYATANELADDLKSWLAGEPILAKRRGKLRQARRWANRNPVKAFAIGVTAVALAGVIGGLAWHHQQLANQRDRANQKYSETRATVNAMLDDLQTQSLLEIPQLADLTLAQTERAAKLFEELAAENPSERSRLDLARLKMTAGTIHIAQDRPERGQAYLKQAVALIQQLETNGESAAEIWHHSIAAQVKLASALAAQGQTSEAIQALEPAETLAFKMLERDANSVRTLDDAAWTKHVLGCMYVNAGQHKAAIDEFSVALQLRSRALNSDSSNDALRSRLAESLVNLALCQSMLGRNRESLANYRTAIVTLDAMRPQGQDIEGVVVSKCTARLNAANLLVTLDDPAAARTLLSEAINDLEPFHRAAQNDYRFRNTLFMLYANRGEYGDLSSSDNTVFADWGRAIELADDPSNRDYCELRRIRLWISDNQLDAAKDRLAHLAKQPQLSSNNRFLLAAAWGAVAGRIENQMTFEKMTSKNLDRNGLEDSAEEPSPTNRSPIASSMNWAIDQSVDQLQHLARLGELAGNPDRRDYLRESDDFRLVRQRLGESKVAALLAIPPDEPGDSNTASK